MAAEKKPLVSVIMPCRNARGYAGRALRSLLDEWSIKSCEFLVVDGGSADGTKEEIAALINPPNPPINKRGDFADFAALKSDGSKKGSLGDDVLWYAPSRGAWVREAREEDRYAWNPPVDGRRRPFIRIIEHPFRRAAEGLNAGILQSRGAYVARVDPRATYAPGYLRRCIELLEQKEAANAGGVEVPVAGTKPLGRAIALALGHPLGGRLPKPGHSGYADDAESGTYRRKLFDELGLFDAKSRAGEAAEMNVRILLAGRKIWVDRGLKVFSEAPASLRELAGRYFRHGRGRARTAKKHGMFTDWRQIASPLLVAMTGYSLIRGFKAPFSLLFIAAYAAAVLAAALFGPAPEGAGGFETRLTAAAALVTMHMAWGAGFLWGLAADW